MNPLRLDFYTASFLLFGILIYRLMKAKSLTRGGSILLFLMLYGALFVYSFLWVQTPPVWFERTNLFFFLWGIVCFLSEPLVRSFQKNHQSETYLKQLKKEKGGLHEVVMAAHLLSQARMGALMAMERKKSLTEWCQKGMIVDAVLSREILYSVFTPPGALHDGGVIIRENRLAAGGVIFPLTKTPNFPKELGTRHRAALGFSEATDALCLVVSEESGTISIADRGFLYYDIPAEKLPVLLARALRFRLKTKKDKAMVQTWELAKV